MSHQLNVTWLQDRYEVVQDPVGDMFVKNSLISKKLQVKLKAFQLNTMVPRGITQGQSAKIGEVSIFC